MAASSFFIFFLSLFAKSVLLLFVFFWIPEKNQSIKEHRFHAVDVVVVVVVVVVASGDTNRSSSHLRNDRTENEIKKKTTVTRNAEKRVRTGLNRP